MRAAFVAAWIGGLLALGAGSVASCAEPAEIDRAIALGRDALKKMWSASGPGGQRTLAAVALLKAGEPHEGEVETAELKHIRGKIKEGVYSPGSSPQEAIYVAGVDAMLAVELPDLAVRRELLEPLAKYLVGAQRANGSWDYMGEGGMSGRASDGDTSVTQYGCLGLWAAQRGGVEVDPAVWERVIAWHAATASPEGFVGYTPFPNASGLSPQMSINSLASIHIAVQQLNPAAVPKLLSGVNVPPIRPVAAPETRRFGFLEPIPLDVVKKKPVSTNRRVSDEATRACQRVFNTVLPAIKDRTITPGAMGYYLYSLERLAALADRPDFDGYDWYGVSADFLVKTQTAEGTWPDGSYGGLVDTSFKLLFLVRATAKTLDRPPPSQQRIGGGLLAGGRGLPDDLTAPPTNPKKRTSPLGDLLSSLEKANLDDIDAAQTELVEQIQLGDRQELIGQTDRIVQLLPNRDAEVRRTAVWALGRTNDLSLARHLVQALDDRDIGVAIEAHNALCWLSRDPTAFDLPQDPLDDLPEDAPQEARTAAQSAWKSRALRAWGEWYLDHRPFADRGDAFETWLRTRLREVR